MMLRQTAAVVKLVTPLHRAELILGSIRLLEILGIDADSLGKVVKHLASKCFVLMQKISDLDDVRVTPTLVRQIRFCGRDDVENVFLVSQVGLGMTQIFKTLPAADV